MGIIYRHQDYLLRIPEVPVAGLQEVPLKLDSDAPFALRLVRSRNIGISGWRFQTPRKAWQSSKLRTDMFTGLGGDTVSASLGSIIYPQMVYPVDDTILVDIGNLTGSPILNAQLLFRGSKCYRPGQIPAPSYPARISPLTFTYPLIVPNVDPFVGDANSIVRDNQLKIDSDSDMVIRFGVCDPFTMGVDGGSTFKAPIPLLGLSGAIYRNVYVQLMDESHKAYSNVPIHVNDLLGQGRPTPALTGGDVQVLFQPGLFSPEFYVPAQHSIYLDVHREEDPADADIFRPVDLNFRFGGAKVFWR